MNQKDLLLISVTIFLTIIAWVIIEVRAINKETPTDAQIEAVTLEYTVNTDILDILEKKVP